MLRALKNSFASRAAAMGMVIAGTISPAFANGANGEKAAEPPVATESVQLAGCTQSLEERNAASIKAGDYGFESDKNIGIVLYYGKGNKGTPDQFGGYMAEKIENRALERGHNFDAEYFVVLKRSDMKGIGVEFSMGPKGIDDMEFTEALEEKNLDKIIDARIKANEILKGLSSAVNSNNPNPDN